MRISMWAAQQASGGSRQLERLLESILVPVEPNVRFSRRLKARLVRYHGAGGPSPWLIIGLIGAGIVLLAGMLGLALRLILTLVGIIAWFNRKKRIERATSRPA